MGKGDIYQENYADIINLCIRCSRDSMRLKPAKRDMTMIYNKISSGGITRAEIGNLLEDFKTDILGTLTRQLDIMQAKQKQAKEEQNLVIFCPRCRKKHSHKECLLDMVQTCAICTKDHATESCPSLQGLKAVYKEVEEETEPVYLLNQRSQWQPRQTGTLADPSSFFQNPQYNSQQYLGAMWQNKPPFSNWSQQPFHMPPWPNQSNQNNNWPNSSYFPPF